MLRLLEILTSVGITGEWGDGKMIQKYDRSGWTEEVQDAMSNSFRVGTPKEEKKKRKLCQFARLVKRHRLVPAHRHRHFE